MGIHTIRLRAPWRWERQDDCDLWRRVFRRPSNLSEQETVRLVFCSESSKAVAMLNDRILGPAPAVYEVTNSLEVRNTLTLRVPGAVENGDQGREPPFEVRLEIESRENA